MKEESVKKLALKLSIQKKIKIKLSIQEIKIVGSGPITSWQIEGEKVEAVSDFLFFVSKIIAYDDCSHEETSSLEGKL